MTHAQQAQWLDSWLDSWHDEEDDLPPVGPDSVFTLIRMHTRDVVQRAHLQAIDAAFQRVLAGELDRVLLTTPPQVGKSERASQWGPFWWLCHRPKDRIAHVSYAAALAHRNSRRVRNLVRDYGPEHRLWLTGDRTAVDDWELTGGGGMRATGIDGGLTGTPADIAIIDDPHKDRAEADSPAAKEAVWNFWSGTLVPRLAPGAPVILIQTRWAKDDLAGRVLELEGKRSEGGRWEVISCPVYAEKDDVLGRAPGDPLPHPKIREDDTDALRAHWEDKRHTTTSRDWSSLFMCSPVAKVGALLDEALIALRNDYSPIPEHTYSAVAVDPSGGGRDLAGVIGGVKLTDGTMRWTHDRSLHGGGEEWGRAACLLAHEIDADRIVYEYNYGADLARLAIRTSWDALVREGLVTGLCPMLVASHSKKGKLLRAEPIAQQVKEGRAVFGAPLPELKAEWLEWHPTSNYSPGRIDASVHLAYALLDVPGSAALVSSPVGARKGGVGPTVGNVLTATRIQRR